MALNEKSGDHQAIHHDGEMDVYQTSWKSTCRDRFLYIKIFLLNILVYMQMAICLLLHSWTIIEPKDVLYRYQPDIQTIHNKKMTGQYDNQLNWEAKDKKGKKERKNLNNAIPSL